MSKIIFLEDDIKRLKGNEKVDKVREESIVYVWEHKNHIYIYFIGTTNI